MKRTRSFVLLPAAMMTLVLAACAITEDPQEVEAVRDFVAANDLREVDQIRFYSSLSFSHVNDYYVTVPTRRGDYLLEFRSRCRALGVSEFTPDMVDVRRESNIVRARFDTIRGCHIDKIYEITDEQRRELEGLGDAPGDEVFLSDEEEG